MPACESKLKLSKGPDVLPPRRKQEHSRYWVKVVKPQRGEIPTSSALETTSIRLANYSDLRLAGRTSFGTMIFPALNSGRRL